MNKINKIIAAALIAVIFTFSGCFPTGEKPVTKQNIGEYALGESFEYSCDKVTAKFTLPENIPQATRIAVKTKDIERDDVIKLFFGDRPYTQGLENEGMSDVYETDDGFFHLSFISGEISFSDNRVCNFEAPVNLASLKNFCKPRCWDYNPPSDAELEGFPREAALNKAAEIFETLGVNNIGEPEIYPMSVDAIKRVVEEDNPPYNIEELSQENECYVLCFPQFFDGTELSDLPSRAGKIWYNSSKITLVVTREGVALFIAEALFEDGVEVLSQEPVQYDLDFALGEFKRYHDAAYFDEDILIYDFKPVYYLSGINESGACEFIPMWEFDGRSTKQEEGYINRGRYVAAVTSDSGILKTYNGV